MFGGGKSQETSTEPWEGIKPYLTDTYGQASGLYQGGVGANPYPGPTVAGFDPYQSQAMNMMVQNARSGQSTGAYAENALKNIMGGGGSPYLSGAMAQNRAGTPGIRGAMAQSWQNQPYAQNVLGTSQGAFLGSNPYLDQVYQTAANKASETFRNQTMPGIRAGAQGSGMGASSRNALAQGQAAGQFGQGLLDLAGQVYAPAYETERNRMLQASQLGQQGYQGDIANQLTGAGMLQSGQENYLNRLLAGAGQQTQGMLGAAGMVPSLQNIDAQNLYKVGALNQQMNQSELNAMQNYWNQYNQAPWAALGNYANILGGGGGGYGTTTQSGSGSPLLGGLGGAATGAGMAGALGLASTPWVWPLVLGGGALGLLG